MRKGHVNLSQRAIVYFLVFRSILCHLGPWKDV